MNVIVTGSSGFIGSKLVNYLTNKCSDNIFVYGIDKKQINNSLVNNKSYVHYVLDISDKFTILDKILNKIKPDIIYHLAAAISIEESEIYPEIYYKNNVVATQNILCAMKKNNINSLVYASTAAVYKSNSKPLCENDSLEPLSVYGKTKLMCEKMIHDYQKSSNLAATVFRFFNVSGGMDQNDVQFHLIPCVVDKLLNNKEICIFGNNFNTTDGTCVRDYIHVDDICFAFYLALKKFVDNKSTFNVYNLGASQNHSVKKIIELCINSLKKKNLLTKESKISISNKRHGDCAILIANSSKIQHELEWYPICGINKIIDDTISDIVQFQKCIPIIANT